MILIKLIYAIIGSAMWIAMLKYRKTIYDWTGKFYWAEKYLWSGGTVIVIILTWLFLIVISVAYPFWAFDDLGNNTRVGTPSNSQSTLP